MVAFENIQSTNTYFQNLTLSSENLQLPYGVVRKYMNGAVSVESPFDKAKKISRQVSLTSSNDNVSVKHCSCTSVRFCKIHEGLKRTADEQVDVHPKPDEGDELNVSMITLATVATSNDNDDLNEEGYKNWILRKNEEKKRIEENKISLKETQEKEQQHRLEQERENFKRWLRNKKVADEKQKMEQEQMRKCLQKKDEDKKMRNTESHLRYQLWLKKKEAEKLEKKIRAQMDTIKVADDKERRVEENKRAYKDWLEGSRNKPKPIPPSRGLDSLRSSISVAYINPVPWTPNIEGESKPISK